MSMRNLIIFDFDCTISARHYWGLMMNDDKVQPDDLSVAHVLRGAMVHNFGTPNASISKSIDNDLKDLFIDYVFGSEERLKWLKKVIFDLTQLKNVEIEIWTRSFGAAIHDLLSQSYTNFRDSFDEIIDRTKFRSDKKSRMCDTRRSLYKNVFIFDDSADEYAYKYTSSIDHFSVFDNIHFYNQLKKEGVGIPIDNSILQSIKRIIDE